ncbi:MAG: hypothetical protein J6B73_00915 [Methanobrevibacter sp.]|uniref:hypothetical protein n=1 Tax=Methanobrevibacter sp. TaxID=66852 RepID=UPI001B028F9E|nr:hypothetical protein [Methanobrevibacter sp.]MBO5150716.1 hypothetical protein [Methanobrevibacter sp.]
MIAITRKEEVVFDQIKIFDVEYDGEIPISALKKELCSGSFHEYDLVQVLNSLANKQLIDFKDSIIKLISSDKEISTVNSKKDLEELELNLKEKESFELIKTLVNEKNLVSKYILEGNLLYGDLKLTNFRMYHIILSLENKGLLKHIHKSDGEYYLLVE